MEKECLFSCEVWHKVDWIPQNFYEVSNYGRCRSLDHQGYSKHHVGYRLFNGVLLKGEVGEFGKIRYQLGRRKILAHILVAKAFPDICGKWFNGCEVHHIDYNPSNNKASNLIVLTKAEHKKIHTAIGQFSGANNPFYNKHHPKELIEQIASKRRIKVCQFSMDGDFIKTFDGIKIAAESVGGNASNLIRCLKGKWEQYKGFKWAYDSSPSSTV